MRQLQTAVAALIRLLETFRRRLLNPLITRSRKEDDTMNLKMLSSSPSLSEEEEEDDNAANATASVVLEDKLDFKRTACTAYPLTVL